MHGLIASGALAAAAAGSGFAAAGPIALEGTARVSRVQLHDDFGNPVLPSFLTRLPEVGDAATFLVAYDADGFGADTSSASHIGAYPHHGVSSVEVVFGADGRFETELWRTVVFASDGGNPFIDVFQPQGERVRYDDADWNSLVSFVERSTDLYHDDSLRTWIDLGAFLADGYDNISLYAYAGHDLMIDLDIESAAYQQGIYRHPVGIAVDEGGPPARIRVGAVDATGFRWHKDGEPIGDGGLYSGALTDTLTVQAELAAAGVYTAEVDFPTGAVTSDTAVLAVRPVADICLADLTGDGILDLDDVVAYVTAFTGGCP